MGGFWVGFRRGPFANGPDDEKEGSELPCGLAGLSPSVPSSQVPRAVLNGRRGPDLHGGRGLGQAAGAPPAPHSSSSSTPIPGDSYRHRRGSGSLVVAPWRVVEAARVHGGRPGQTAAMELWRQCTHWLIQCRVLPPSHRVTWEGAQVCELAQALRDGVLLCQLLNNLLPHAINLREVNLRPQMSQVRCLLPG